jgi:hypothetical protein
MTAQNESVDVEVINLFDDADDFDDFDPLEIDDMEINQEEMDDDNPYDTIDFPTMRNMPEEVRSREVFTPANMGSAADALRAMCKQNPARRPVLLNIVGLCEGGAKSSEISEAVAEWQKDNRSVYSALTLCRMLERAGALEFIAPETTDEVRDVAEGVTYLEIKDQVDPVWVATPEALEVRAELTNGDSFRNDVLDGKEVVYLEVYSALVDYLASGAKSVEEVENFVEGFAITQSPKRYGTHFLDVLERCDAIEWHAEGWGLTDLGRNLVPELKAAAESACATA